MNLCQIKNLATQDIFYNILDVSMIRMNDSILFRQSGFTQQKLIKFNRIKSNHKYYTQYKYTKDPKTRRILVTKNNSMRFIKSYKNKNYCLSDLSRRRLNLHRILLYNPPIHLHGMDKNCINEFYNLAGEREK